MLENPLKNENTNDMRILLYVSVIFISLTSFTCSKNRIIINEGDIKNDMFYLEGEIEPFSGICIVPHSKGNSIKEIRRFKSGVIDGEAISYYKDGTLKRKGTYNFGKMSGVWEQWYKNGNKEFQASYIKDEMTGCFKEWYTNGRIKEEGQYNQNHRVGTWKFYDEGGSLLYEKQYTKLAQPINKSYQSPCI